MKDDTLTCWSNIFVHSDIYLRLEPRWSPLCIYSVEAQRNALLTLPLCHNNTKLVLSFFLVNVNHHNNSFQLFILFLFHFLLSIVIFMSSYGFNLEYVLFILRSLLPKLWKKSLDDEIYVKLKQSILLSFPYSCIFHVPYI